MAETFEEYLEEFDKFFHRLAHKYSSRYHPDLHDDLYQEARIGAWRGWEAWTPEKTPEDEPGALSPRWRWAMAYAKTQVKSCVWQNHQWTGRLPRKHSSILEERYLPDPNKPTVMHMDQSGTLEYFTEAVDDIANQVLDQIACDEIMELVTDEEIRVFLEGRVYRDLYERESWEECGKSHTWVFYRLKDLRPKVRAWQEAAEESMTC
jgi:hypothetical protein